MHEKLFPGSRLKISYQTPPLIPLFLALFGFLLFPYVTHNSLFSLQNSINLNYSLSVNLLRSSCEDMLLYNKHTIFSKYLLHTWATRKSCFKSVFYGQKAKICCKNTAAKSNWFDFAAVFNGWATCSILYPCAAQHLFAARGWKMLLVASEL